MLQAADLRRTAPAGEQTVHELRQVLLWPLRLRPDPQAAHRNEPPWQMLRDAGDATPWREHFDEYTRHAHDFHERHYNEFVTFLPYVQRFLYGEGRQRRGAEGGALRSPMRIFRRRDVAAVRVTARDGDAPVTLTVVHVDLYFFANIDVVLFNVELAAAGLPLSVAQEVLYRFGRAYPAGWDASGQALHCMASVEWLDAEGRVLAESDARDRDRFIAHVAEHRAPRIARHWEFMLAPLVWQHSRSEGGAEPAGPRVQQIEYYRMPMMAWLAVDDPRALTRADFVRLGLVTGGGHGPQGDALPYAEHHLSDFETRYCYDRYWSDGGSAPNTRYLCTGLSMVVIGQAGSEFYGCRDRGVLAQFRHQHFLLFLIAHFQKATLLMFNDRLAETLADLDISSADSIRRFKRLIRQTYVTFLSFTHGYWFQEVSEQAHAKALYALCRTHLESETLYREVKERVHDMNGYLDADALRRQANTVVRLTVVTIFGLIGTVTTGFLGMNLIAEAEAPMASRVVFFALVMAATLALTFYTIAKSKRLSDFLDVMSDERLSAWTKVKAFAAVWTGRGGDD